MTRASKGTAGDPVLLSGGNPPSLRPVPPGTSKQKEVRYLDIREGDPLDEAQLQAWVEQASRLSGERM